MSQAPDTFDVLCDEVRSVRRRRRRRRAPLAVGLDPRIVPPAVSGPVEPTRSPTVDGPIARPEAEPGFIVRPVHALIPLANYLIVAAFVFLAYPFILHFLDVMLDAARVRTSFLFVYIIGRVQMASEWIAAVLAVVAWLAIGGMVARSYRDGRLTPVGRLPAELLPPERSHALDLAATYGIAAAIVGLAYWSTYDLLDALLLILLMGTRIVMTYPMVLAWSRVIGGIAAVVCWLVLGHFFATRYGEWSQRVPRRARPR